jgi:hypothetical protein
LPVHGSLPDSKRSLKGQRIADNPVISLERELKRRAAKAIAATLESSRHVVASILRQDRHCVVA